MLKIIFIILTFYVSLSAQQNDEHVWKVLNGDDGSKFWYDVSTIDTINGDKFNVWVLETYKPPRQYDGIDGDVFRSKTLYTINLTTVRYGILKVQYFNMTNQEIFSFDYDNPMPPESIRYPYPVTNDSKLFYLIKELYGPNGDQNQRMN